MCSVIVKKTISFESCNSLFLEAIVHVHVGPKVLGIFSETYVSSSRSPTRPVQQQWWSLWSSSGPPSAHIISGEVELLKAIVRFALVGVCYISEEHARLSGPPHHRDTLGEGTSFSFLCMCALSLLWPLRSRAKTTWPDFLKLFKASEAISYDWTNVFRCA